MVNASSGYMGMAVETTPGTALAPTKYLPVKEVDFPVDNGFIDVKEIRGSRQAYNSYDGAVKPSARIKTGFYGGGAMGVILRGLFGSDTTTTPGGAVSSKMHTFSDTSTLPYLTFERASAIASGTPLIAERMGGNKIESVSFKCAFGQDVDVEIMTQALKFPDSTITAASAPVYPTYNPFIFKGASVLIDTVASTVFKNINFDFKNTLERQDTLRGSRESALIFEGGLDCTITGTLSFQDLALYNKFSATTVMDIKAVFVGDSLEPSATPPTFYQATFEWTKVKLSKFGIPFVAGGIVSADATFKVTFDQSVGRSIQATLQNLDASGAYST